MLFLLCFLYKKKLHLSHQQFYNLIESIGKIYFDYNVLNIYTLQGSKAILCYTTSLHYKVHSIDVNKHSPFGKVFLSGEEVRAVESTKEQSFINAMKAKSAIMIPLKNDGVVLGSILLLYKRSHKKFSIIEKINMAIFTKIISKTLVSFSHSNMASISKYGMVAKPLTLKMRAYQKARSIQMYLNTRYLPIEKNFSISAYYMASEELGGDFFDIRDLGNIISIVIADSVGNGVEACMDATLLKSVSDRHTKLLSDKNPDEFLSRVGYDLMSYYRTRFPAMLAIAIEKDSGVCYYANAGMLLPYTSLNDKISQFPSVKGMLLGYDSTSVYQRGIYKFANGERLFIYSDVYEAALMSKNRNFTLKDIKSFYKNLVISMDKNPSTNIDIASEALSAIGNPALQDDATFICMQYLEEKSFSFRFKSVMDIANIENSLTDFMNEYNFDKWDMSCLSTSIWEACNNSLQHSKMLKENREAIVFGYINASEIFLSINDYGIGFDYASIFQHSTESMTKHVSENTSGIGIFLMQKSMDSVHYRERGNLIEMTKKRSVNKSIFANHNTSISRRYF